MQLFYSSLTLITFLAAKTFADNNPPNFDDPRGPCGPCYVDASHIEAIYWIASTQTITGYDVNPTSITVCGQYPYHGTANTYSQFGSTATITVADLVDCSGTATLTNLGIAAAHPTDVNIARGNFQTVIGDEYIDFFVGPSIDLSLGVATATGTILLVEPRKSNC